MGDWALGLGAHWAEVGGGRAWAAEHPGLGWAGPGFHLGCRPRSARQYSPMQSCSLNCFPIFHGKMLISLTLHSYAFFSHRIVLLFLLVGGS